MWCCHLGFPINKRKHTFSVIYGTFPPRENFNTYGSEKIFEIEANQKA
jgi:hypothetical protein